MDNGRAAKDQEEEHAATKRRIRDLERLTEAALEDVKRTEDPQDADAVICYLEAVDAFSEAYDTLARTYVEVGHLRREDDPWPTPAEATRHLLELRKRRLPRAGQILDGIVAEVFIESDDPEVRAGHDRLRAMLVRRGWTTSHELETFPEPSLRAIVAERVRQWLETQ
jgi:hypothetical protein